MEVQPRKNLRSYRTQHTNTFHARLMYQIISLGLLLILLLTLPPIGLYLTGYSLPPHFALFAIPTAPGIASFSWPAWGIVAGLIGATLVPVVCRFSQVICRSQHRPIRATTFPWWGWITVLWVALSWIFAWTRLDWFIPWQVHTFPLLWFGYIVLLNALTYQRSNQCFLLHRPWFLGQLFFLSSGFWWTFEYLNQFVNNWHYVNLPDTTQLQYFFYTSLSFSTVLPAVLSTYEWLATFPRLTQPFATWHQFPWITNLKSSWIFLTLGSIGLGLIGIWPTVLFPLLWVCPLCLLVGVQGHGNEFTGFRGLTQGDWRPILLSGLSAFVCGLWWELWNIYSLVHWEYTLPSVHAFKIFEMPILGYAGYLPFGLTCLLVTELVLGYQSREQLSRLSKQTENLQYS